METTDTSLLPIYFDHEQSDFGSAMGISKPRQRELQKELQNLPHPDSTKWTVIVEALVGLAKNENERIFLAVQAGKNLESLTRIARTGGRELRELIARAVAAHIETKSEKEGSTG